MRLLYDENLSHRLVDALSDVFAGSVHVRTCGLERAGDEAVWRHAAEDGLAIVTKDDDFSRRVLLLGPPPKVVSLRLGNCSTADIAALLRRRAEDLRTFDASERECLFVVMKPSS